MIKINGNHIIFIMIVLCLSISSFLIAGTSVDETKEEEAHYIRNDKILNAAYQMITGMYTDTDDKEAKALLEKAQLAWIKYRDLTVSAEIARHKSKLRYYRLMADLTTERIDRLKGMIEAFQEGREDHKDDGTTDKAKNYLNKLSKLEKAE